jgi:hypothetical protein
VSGPVRPCRATMDKFLFTRVQGYEGKAVIPLCHNLIPLCRANGPPLAREATAGSPTRRARQNNWSAPTQGTVGLKLVELVSAGSLFSFWGVSHFGP